MAASSSSSRTPRWREFLYRHALSIILLVLAVIFIVENTNNVKIRVLAPTVSAPLWLTLLVTLAAGMLIPILARRRRKGR